MHNLSHYNPLPCKLSCINLPFSMTWEKHRQWMVKLFLQVFPLKLQYSQFILNLGFWFLKSIEEKLSGDFYPVISEDNRNLQWLQPYKCTQERHGVHKGVLTLGNPAHLYLLQMASWWLAFSVWENNIIIQMLQKHWSDAFLLSLGAGGGLLGWFVGFYLSLEH